MKSTQTISSLLTLAAICCANAQTTENPQPAKSAASASKPKIPLYGFDFSFTRPTDSKIRKAFGEEWTGFGPNYGSALVRKGLSFSPDFSLLQNREGKSKNRAFLAFVGVQVQYGFGDTIYVENDAYKFKTFSPYVGASANIVYSDISSRTYGFARKRFGVAGSVTLGTTIGRNFALETRYSYAPEIQDLDFSNFSVTFKIRF